MKNVANRIQNTRVFAASRSAPSAAAMIGAVLGAGAGNGSVPSSPYGLKPRSLGRSRMIMSTAKAATPSIPHISASATRQPIRSVSLASIGRNTNWPVATLAVRIPTASPRRAENQRAATVAPSTSAVMPVPIPTTTPHNSINCQSFVIASDVTSAEATISKADSTTLRRP